MYHAFSHTVAITLGLAIGSAVATAQAQSVITLPEPNYAVAQATVHIIKAVAEQELGLKVETVPTTAVPVIWAALDRGKGEIDAWPEVWLPNQQGLVDEYVTKKSTVALTKNPYKGVQGYCVTKAAEEHGIKSVKDLANPDNAKLFGAGSDGKGKIWVGAPGWLSTNIEQVKAKDYGFAPYFDEQQIDEAVATAQLDAAYKADKPWVGYCYGPHQNLTLYHLSVLDEPVYDAAKWKMVQPKDDPNWLDKSTVATAYPDTLVYIAYSKSLDQRAPEFVKLLNNIRYDSATISGWAYEIAAKHRDPNEVAEEWVKANPKIVAAWVAGQ